MRSESGRWAVPGPGRTVAASAQAWAGPLRQAVDALRIGLDPEGCHALDLLLRPADPLVDQRSCRREDVRTRGARALAITWLLARAFGAIDANARLKEAELWFAGSSTATTGLNREAEERALALLHPLRVDEAFDDLLPYILDPHGPGTRRAVLKDPANRLDRRTRKDTGVFYTPADVAQFMVRGTLDGLPLDRLAALIDPACGTGVFLRAAFRETLKEERWSATEIIRHLYGLDISVLAIEACAFVLTHDWLKVSAATAGEPIRRWRYIRLNLAAVDSLTLEIDREQLAFPPDEARRQFRAAVRDALLEDQEIDIRQVTSRDGEIPWGLELSNVFPERTAGFDAVVTNPPYASMGPRRDLRTMSQRFEFLRGVAVAPATNMYGVFIELMWRLANGSGSASTVVPLSVAYSSEAPFRGLRSAMERAEGQWRFAFFDRTPDALFGDDVKQRAAILFRQGGRPYSVSVGPLQRWTSRTRYRLFDSIEFTTLESVQLESLIPKLAGRLEAEAYQKIQGRRDRLRSARVAVGSADALKKSSDEQNVFVAGTAYNWLSVYRTSTFSDSDPGPLARSSSVRLSFQSGKDADAAYAILSSRLTYWLWRVEGDGFHVTRAFLDRIPFDWRSFSEAARQRLGSLGKDLWERVTQHPVVSVNGGRETISFCPYGSTEQLDEIDRILIDASKLPRELESRLKSFILATTVVDFTDENRNRNASRPLIAWGAR